MASPMLKTSVAPRISAKISARVRLSYSALDVVDFGVPSLPENSFGRVSTASAAKMSFRSSSVKEQRKRWNGDKANTDDGETSAQQLAGHLACKHPGFSKIVRRTQDYSLQSQQSSDQALEGRACRRRR
mmetsp:Transcript_35904/g.73783  ORF Transcript_35904/g.73783 Transcript_35904/m.73783 type:complete len:129 (+) Transcript_35904:497-883(+)